MKMLCLSVTSPGLSATPTKPWLDKTLYYDSHFSRLECSKKFQKDYAHGEEDLYVTFKVDLKW
jgi:hypothetical protein